jgi:hypothetical protein
MRHYAAQVKHKKRINKGKSVEDLLSQVRQEFARPFKLEDSPRECHVSAVYVFNSGEITENAKEQLLSNLARERYGDNVHFIDGGRLDALNEWGTLQSDANARARLLGLRSALKFIITTLEKYSTTGKPDYQPMFIHGIELYLSEPVDCMEKWLPSLFGLWQILQSTELMRAFFIKFSKDPALERLAPKLKSAAETAIGLAKKICQSVDAAIEKMKPLGGS